MPIDYKKYSPMWKIIRAKILSRAGNMCELCGVENYSHIIRDIIHPQKWRYENDSIIGDCEKIIKIMLDNIIT